MEMEVCSEFQPGITVGIIASSPALPERVYYASESMLKVLRIHVFISFLLVLDPCYGFRPILSLWAYFMTLFHGSEPEFKPVSCASVSSVCFHL
jgi:hypothetical protein